MIRSLISPLLLLFTKYNKAGTGFDIEMAVLDDLGRHGAMRRCTAFTFHWSWPHAARFRHDDRLNESVYHKLLYAVVRDT